MVCCSGPKLGDGWAPERGVEAAANGEGALISPARVGPLRSRLGL